MIYKFKSRFNREKEYTIDTVIPLDLYDNFALSIQKFNPKDKSYSYDNIECVLKYNKRGILEVLKLELNAQNFSGFYIFVETFKHRNCLSLGEPLDLIKDDKIDKYANITLDNADTELKLAFEKYIKESNIMNTLFKVFIKGVSYGGKD